ncbi:MAG: hypothetical protein MI741_16720, partial [Rhodospirillales bacterium]|nr:hypothetical protein [Rhodospirillales bacterium]
MIRNVLVFAGILTTATTQAPAQSSSLYVQPVEQQAQPVRYFVEPVEQPDPMIPAIREHSRLAVKPPPPREFQVNDLVTVVIRESMETDFEAELSTEKESKISGE